MMPAAGKDGQQIDKARVAFDAIVCILLPMCCTTGRWDGCPEPRPLLNDRTQFPFHSEGHDMAYSQFSLSEVQEKFQVELHQHASLFTSIEPIPLSETLTAILDENVSLALAISTEKAHSELIIAPMLVELRKMLDRKISFFSGREFNVDSAQGLVGVCDFIISQSAELLWITAPVVATVEAKNENIRGGFHHVSLKCWRSKSSTNKLKTIYRPFMVW